MTLFPAPEYGHTLLPSGRENIDQESPR